MFVRLSSMCQTRSASCFQHRLSHATLFGCEHRKQGCKRAPITATLHSTASSVRREKTNSLERYMTDNAQREYHAYHVKFRHCVFIG